MTGQNQDRERNRALGRLLEEAARGRLTRREVLARAAALGLSAAAARLIVARTAQGQQASPAANGPVHVPIVNKDMTFADIQAAIKSEGQVVVGNWTYTANDALVKRFQQHIKQTYDVDITLQYQGTQSPSTYLANLYAALAAGDNSPYDVLAIEESYWADAQQQGQKNGSPVMEDYLPSGLIPNADRVLDQFRHYPTAIGFQASATPAIVYNKAKVDFLKDWTDLADPRLKGKLTMALPGDITAGGHLLGIAAALGKDYKSVESMKYVVDWTVAHIGPNVVKYTTDSAEMQQLLRSGAAWAVGFWNSLARLEYLSGQAGTQNTVSLVAKSGQYLVNGYTWIPKKAKHPVLAQLFIDWRLSDDGQFPNDWVTDKGAWAELEEGLLGPSYEKDIPSWFKDQYYNYYPTLDQLNKFYKSVDWTAYSAGVGEWMDYYNQKLGL